MGSHGRTLHRVLGKGSGKSGRVCRSEVRKSTIRRSINFVKGWMVALKLGILAGIIGLVLAFSDLRAIHAAMSRAGLLVMAAAFGLSIIVIAMSAIKWRLSVPAAHFLILFRISMITQFYIFFFIGQAG